MAHDTAWVERVDPDLIAAFARTLRRRRKEAGLTQEELAFRAELSVSYMSFLERRERQPTITVLAALCRQLDVTVAGFMAEVEQEMGQKGVTVGSSETPPPRKGARR